MGQPTLRDLREQSGLTIQEVLDGLQAAAQEEAPQHRSGVIHLENRGTANYAMICAFAQVYGISIEAAAAAAQESRRIYREKVSKMADSCLTSV